MREFYLAAFSFVEGIGMSELRPLILGLPIILAAGALFWFIRRAVHRKKLGNDFRGERRLCRSNEIIRLLFVIWCGITAFLTLMPVMAEVRIVYRISYGKALPQNTAPIFMFTPHFKFMPDILSGNFSSGTVWHFIENTIFFVPTGFMLPFITKAPKLWKTALTGFIMSTFIEIAQMFIMRDSDINDIISNTAGAVLGYLIFMLVRKLFPRFTEKCMTKIKTR